MIALSAAALIGLSGPAFSQEFYAGKTVTVLINYPPGGSTDIEGRIVAQHLGKHIPGNPTVIAKNMGGGGGLTATNYLGEAARNDATQVAFFTWNPVHQLLGSPALRVKYDAFRMVAGIPQPAVVYMRKDVPPGLEKPADIAKVTKPFISAGFNPVSHGYLRQNLALDLLGIKFKAVAGYGGNKDVEIAIQQNEVQYSNNSLPGYRASTEPGLIKTGVAIPLYQFDSRDAQGKFSGSPNLPEVPTFLQVYKQIKGADAMPQGVEWDTLVLLSNLMDSMYRAIFLAPGAPDAAVEAMRKAFVSLSKDKEFLAAYSKLLGGAEPAIFRGEEAERVVKDLAGVKPELREFLKAYVAKKSE